MARPLKETADWFKHDFDMRNDDKILAVRRKFGLIGYAIWNMMLEKLSDSITFKVSVTENSLELLAGDFNIDTQLLNEILDYFVKVGLMTKDGDQIFSPKLISRFLPLFRKRELERKTLSNTITENNDDVEHDSTQSRVEESRVDNKRKKEREVASFFLFGDPPNPYAANMKCREWILDVDSSPFSGEPFQKQWVRWLDRLTMDSSQYLDAISQEGALKKLRSLAETTGEAIETIELAIPKGYTSFIALKNGKAHKAAKKDKSIPGFDPSPKDQL